MTHTRWCIGFEEPRVVVGLVVIDTPSVTDGIHIAHRVGIIVRRIRSQHRIQDSLSLELVGNTDNQLGCNQRNLQLARIGRLTDDDKQILKAGLG